MGSTLKTVEFVKVEAARDVNYAISNDGRVFTWPSVSSVTGESVNYAIEMFIPKQ